MGTLGGGLRAQNSVFTVGASPYAARPSVGGAARARARKRHSLPADTRFGRWGLGDPEGPAAAQAAAETDSARPTAPSSASSEKGFSSKAMALRRRAFARIWSSIWPVMKMAGSASPRARIPS
jgi:hypothetical protein